MGQYFIAVNEDKQEWIHPHRFGDGMKFLELALSGGGFLAGLAVLLRKSTVHGLGDLKCRDKVVGSWAGDRVSIVGDYDKDKGILYFNVMDGEESWTDVSAEVIRALKESALIREYFDSKEGYPHD
jgi:hypothetical protein